MTGTSKLTERQLTLLVNKIRQAHFEAVVIEGIYNGSAILVAFNRAIENIWR